MSTEPFLYDGPLKEEILKLRKELAEIELEIRPIENGWTAIEQRLGCFFLPLQLITFGSLWPQGSRLYALSDRKTFLKNRIKDLESQRWTTVIPNQKKASDLDHETSRSVVHELRAYCDLNSYSAREFEDLVASLFRRLGYVVKQTPYTNDGGKDAILTRGEEVTFLECKHFSSGTSVGRPILQKLKGAMIGEGVMNGIIVTSSDFSEGAKEYGAKNQIKVITGKELRDLLFIHKIFHIKKGLETFVLHCDNCLTTHQFSFSLRPEIKTCGCGNTVTTARLINYGTSKSSMYINPYP